MAAGLRPLRALVHKEVLQILRDPSALLIALVLPVVLLFLFAFAVSLDVKGVRFGVVLESQGPDARALAAAYEGTRYLDVQAFQHRRAAEAPLVAGSIRGFVVIPADFEARLTRAEPAVQIITDGSQPNTASFTAAYARGVFQTWRAAPERVSLAPRFWFNPELESRRVLLPGAIAIVMTIIGTLLTALVIAREWERGTMEALLSTPLTLVEMFGAKLLPYFLLGLGTMLICTVMAVTAYGVPLRGSAPALLLISACFLVPALGQGMLISALAKNQFVAAQIALLSGFLPAFLLSGFLFEIESMPAWIRALTHVVAARYFVEALQTLFLAGDVPAQIVRNGLSLLALGVAFFAVIALATRRRLD